MKAYIVNSASISSQSSFDADVENEWTAQEGDFLRAIEPDYKQFIPANLIRRMSRIIKMSLACTQKILGSESTLALSAINVGTGLGCLRDSERFLAQVCQNETGVLSPTSFIQSTHNTIAGQIALTGNHHCHNMTYSNGAHSFENALEDGLMHIREGQDNVLVGGADELTPFVENVRTALNCVTDNSKIGEGAAFFLLSSQKAENSICLNGMTTFELSSKDDLSNRIDSFLASHNLTMSDIDGLALGCTKEKVDAYSAIALAKLAKEKAAMGFKTTSGEFHTAVAIGLEMSVQWLKKQFVVPQCMLTDSTSLPINNVLVYNQTNGRSHALYLLSKC